MTHAFRERNRSGRAHACFRIYLRFFFPFVFRIAGSASIWWTDQIERLVTFDGWQNELFSSWSTFLKVFPPPTSASLSMILKCFQWCLFDWKARPLIWKDGGMSYIGMTSIFPCQCRYVPCVVHQCRKRTSEFTSRTTLLSLPHLTKAMDLDV